MVRKGAFDTLNKGSGALGKVKLSHPRGRPLKSSMTFLDRTVRTFLCCASPNWVKRSGASVMCKETCLVCKVQENINTVWRDS